MTDDQVRQVVSLVALDGFEVDAETVREFERYGSGPESTVGEEYDDDARDEAIQFAFDKIGVEVGA